MAPLYRAGGGSLALGVVIAFHVVWVAVSTALVLVYRWVGGGVAGRGRPLLLAGFGTGAFLSGFLQGFVLFLAIPVEWSLPFGGLTDLRRGGGAGPLALRLAPARAARLPAAAGARPVTDAR